MSNLKESRDSEDPFGFKKLRSMSLEEIYSDLDRQFSSRQYFTSMPASMRVNLDDGATDILITPGQEANGRSLDTGLLSSYLAENLGGLLVNYPSNEEILPWVEKLNSLYEKASNCENYLRESRKHLTESLAGLAKALSVPPAISGMIKGTHQIFSGYVDPNVQVDLDEETLNIYQISCYRETDKLQELDRSVDSLLFGIGRLIALPEDECYSNLFKINIYDTISHKLFEYDLNFWGRELEDGAEEGRFIEFQSKKLHGAEEILSKCYYGRENDDFHRLSKPLSDKLKNDPLVVQRYEAYKNYLFNKEMGCDGLREDFAYLLKIGVPLEAFGVPSEIEFKGSC